MKSNKLRVTIVGTGNKVGISRAHLMGYRYCPDDVEITGIYDMDMEAARAWKREFDLSQAVCFENFDQALANSDAMSICTPNFTHVDMVCGCLKHNVHVLCEKPLSNTIRELEKLKPLLRTSAVKGMINLNYRRIPALRYIEQLMTAGEIGQVYLYRHTMGGNRLANETIPMEWRMRRKQSGSGAIGDFCSHMLDMVHFILRLPEEGITKDFAARKSTFIKQRQGGNGPETVDNDDCAMIIGTLPNGGLVNFMVSRVGAVGNRLEIIGSKAIVRFEMAEPTKVKLQRREKGKAFGPEETVEAPAENPDWHATGVPPEFVACAENVREFIKAIRNHTLVPTDFYTGIRIQEEIESILQVSK